MFRGKKVIIFYMNESLMDSIGIKLTKYLRLI